MSAKIGRPSGDPKRKFTTTLRQTTLIEMGHNAAKCGLPINEWLEGVVLPSYYDHGQRIEALEVDRNASYEVARRLFKEKESLRKEIEALRHQVKLLRTAPRRELYL